MGNAVPIRPRTWLTWTLFGAALTAAAIAARPFAGGWNDGSRLATVESLVDYHTLAIDQSIFTNPALAESGNAAAYSSADPLSIAFGTGDKLFINGHYYSDKSPVPALALASAYYAIQEITGLHARDNVARFCRFLTIASSGLAFAISVTALFVLFADLGLSLGIALAISASFGLSTMALTYAEHVNNHSLLLGVTSLLMLALYRWLQSMNAGAPAAWRLTWIGGLVGMGYAIDLGIGPPLVAATGMLVAYRTRALGSVAVFACGMAPWLILHHVVNFMVGGTLAPANANAAYFQWPGCSFTSQNMTGGWHHASFGNFVLYALSLLFGKRGFVGHNLPLFLTLPALVLLIRRRGGETPLVIYSVAFCVLAWLMYAVNSTNSSGQCCSIRWFLPLLAPGYFVVAVALRERPEWRTAFFVLSGWGGVVGHANVWAWSMDAAHGSLFLADSGSDSRQPGDFGHFSQPPPFRCRPREWRNRDNPYKSGVVAGALQIA